MVEPNGLQREGTDEWREGIANSVCHGLVVRVRKAASGAKALVCGVGNVAAEAATHKTKSPRAPRLLLL